MGYTRDKENSSPAGFNRWKIEFLVTYWSPRQGSGVELTLFIPCRTHILHLKDDSETLSIMYSKYENRYKQMSMKTKDIFKVKIVSTDTNQCCYRRFALVLLLSRFFTWCWIVPISSMSLLIYTSGAVQAWLPITVFSILWILVCFNKNRSVGKVTFPKHTFNFVVPKKANTTWGHCGLSHNRVLCIPALNLLLVDNPLEFQSIKFPY